MVDTRYKPKFNTDEFLTAFTGDGLYSTGWFVNAIRCSSKTAKTYLDLLVAEGAIKKIPVDEGDTYLWQLVKKRGKKND